MLKWRDGCGAWARNFFKERVVYILIQIVHLEQEAHPNGSVPRHGVSSNGKVGVAHTSHHGVILCLPAVRVPIVLERKEGERLLGDEEGYF